MYYLFLFIGRGELSLLQQQLRQATSSPRSSERPPRSPPPAPAHQNNRSTSGMYKCY